MPIVLCGHLHPEAQDLGLGHSVSSDKDSIKTWRQFVSMLCGWLPLLFEIWFYLRSYMVSLSLFLFLTPFFRDGSCAREGCIYNVVDPSVYLLEKNLKKLCFFPGLILELPSHRSRFRCRLFDLIPTWEWGWGWSKHSAVGLVGGGDNFGKIPWGSWPCGWHGGNTCTSWNNRGGCSLVSQNMKPEFKFEP